MIIQGTRIKNTNIVVIPLNIVSNGLVLNIDSARFNGNTLDLLSANKGSIDLSIGNSNTVDLLTADAFPLIGNGASWLDLTTGPDFTLPNGATYSSDNTGILTFNRTLHQSAHADSLPSALTTFTADTWVKFNNLVSSNGQATCTITEVYDYTPINFTIGCGVLGTHPEIWQGGYFDGTSWHLAGNFTPTTGVWYNMVVTYNGSYIKFYVDGALNDTTASSTTPASSGLGLHVGERWDYPSGDQSYLDGSIPVVRVYDRALTDSEVLYNFNVTKGRFGL